MLRQQLNRKGLTEELHKIILAKGLNRKVKIDGEVERPQFFFDFHDIVLIYLYRGTNFSKIAKNVAKEIKRLESDYRLNSTKH